MELRYIPESGFVARGPHGPQRNVPRDWIVWHFTHVDNLSAVVAAGKLVCGTAVQPTRDVAEPSVKARRAMKVVDPDDAYPRSTVNDHVPFYIAAKSPMLYVMKRGHPGYQGGCDPLIFLGVPLGDIIDAGLIWCASDSNAATKYVKFSRDPGSLGSFVDFDLLRQRDWYNTADDGDRKSRRAAELLVLGEVPLGLVKVVVAKSDDMLARAKRIMSHVGGERQYWATDAIYY